MRTHEAIERADAMRPNSIPRPDKDRWLWQLEMEFAEIMGQEIPEMGPDEDIELLLPDPKAYVYVLYLLPFIDLYLEDTDLYQIDMIQANNMITEVKTWLSRTGQKEQTAYRIKGVFI